VPANSVAVCLMGPTASGKTELALRLADKLPVDIVSVDSALVYRGMDIGTAKPDQETLRRYPHRLLDIREPEESYSAGDFVRDATAAITNILEAGRVPLLVGGTMMYFRALTRGMAQLPPADRRIREAIDAEAAAEGWPALHRKLAAVDKAAAERISANDSQRIQRALEVYRASGRTITEWHRTAQPDKVPSVRFVKFGLVPHARPVLHSRIEKRLAMMLGSGFLDEVRRLRGRPGLSARSPSMRAVGYRQLWSHLDGECDLETAVARALAATRQLAKRQLTWLRSESGLCSVDPLEPATVDTIVSMVEVQTGRRTSQ
jgi:tRNA dimethylallyltransferase